MGFRSGEGVPPLVNGNNGEVQTNPKVFLIFWGSNWNTSDTGIKSALEGFYQGLTGSANYSEWSGILRQYCGPNGCPAANGATIGGVWVDPEHTHPTSVCDDPPNNFGCTGQSVYGEVNRAVHTAGSGWSAEGQNPNAQFIVIPSKYTTYVSGWDPSGSGGFCGYHSQFESATYTFLPDDADESSTNPFAYGTSCAYTGDSSATNADTGAASHEYAETVTDPHVLTGPAWLAQGAPFGEIGDLCASSHDQYHLSGMWVQGEWDDHANGCALYDANPPTVVPTDPPDGVSDITQTAAILNANVNPNGTRTHAFFEYGTTSSYGHIVPSTKGIDVGAGTSTILVSQALTELAPDTTYHFRSVVYNAWSGNIAGPDQTFTTAAARPSPSYGANGTTAKDIFYHGANNTVWDWEWASSKWTNYNFGGSPAGNLSVLQSAHSTDAYYRGADGTIWDWEFVEGKGTNYNLGGSAAGDPTAVLLANGTENIYYRGTDGAIWGEIWNGTGWTNTRLGGSAVGVPSVVTSKGVTDVYYRGTDGTMWDWEYNGSKWTDYHLGGSLGGDPSAVVVASGGEDIFYRGGEGAIWGFIWNGTGWTNTDLGNSALGTPSAAYVEGKKATDVYYRGTDGTMWDWEYNGSKWTDYHLGGSPAGDPAVLTMPGEMEDIYYQGVDKAVWGFIWNGTSWTNTRLG